MNSNRLWTIGAFAVIAALLALTWFIGVSPQLAVASTADRDRSAVETQNMANELTLAKLKADFEGIEDLRAELADARLAVPASMEQALLIGQIGDLAKRHDIDVTSLNFSSPTPFVEAAAEDEELASALTRVNSDNFLILPLDIQMTGKYGDIMDFINAIQVGPRLVLVHDLGMTDGVVKDSATVTMSASGEAFVLLDAASVPEPEVDSNAAVDPAAEPTAE